ncbi:MAG TPA: ABC transporter permease, partial [Verrucomicrobiae bacterium]|nr:ABC transporter permease [Verrucomicrobiae bacterium]
MNDIKFALRQLAKNPGFTAVAALTLALGIGANTAIFTTLYSLVWRPLPVEDPGKVVNLHQSFGGPSARQALGGINRLSYPEYLNYRDRTRTLSGLLGFEDANFTLGEAESSRVFGALATGNYFSVLGVSPELGRVWTASECDVPGACPVVVLSHEFWQRRLSADPAVVGRTLFLNHQAFTVIGVLPRKFRGTELQVPEIWVPLLMRGQLFKDEPGRLAAKDFSWLQVVGRLSPGVSLAEARQELGIIALQSDADSSITKWPARKSRVDVKTGAYFNSPEDIQKGFPVALVVMFVFALLLVVVCANVSNLVLARASTRRREIGIRLSLGASRTRLVGQLLVESFLLGGLAGGLGLALAFSAPRLMLTLLPPDLLAVLDFTPSLPILGYCAAVSVLAAACVGLAPALHATRLGPAPLLSAQAAPLGTRIAGVRMRNVMVITQVAVSVLLLVCAGLLVRGLHRALSTDLGFDRKNLFVLSVDLEASGYNPAQAHQFCDSLAGRLAGLAGVKATSLADLGPFMGTSSTTVHLDEDKALATPSERLANMNTVSRGYFETLGVGLLAGRGFSRADGHSSARTAIVNEA